MRLALGAMAAAALLFWVAWHPAPSFYWYNVPIAAPFCLFLVERARSRRRLLPGLIDGLVVGLALLRVVAPPWPLASGHVLFTGHAVGTARGAALRGWSRLVLAQVVLTKLFLSGGWASLALGLLGAAGSSWLWRRVEAPERKVESRF